MSELGPTASFPACSSDFGFSPSCRHIAAPFEMALFAPSLLDFFGVGHDVFLVELCQ